MVQRVATVAFEGIEARVVDVQVQVAPGLPAFSIVGLPDKAVSEAKERVRAARQLAVASRCLPAVSRSTSHLPICRKGATTIYRLLLDLWLRLVPFHMTR